MESKYLERFKRLTEVPDSYCLRGDRIVVEMLPKEEIKSKGGIILQSDPNQVRGETAAQGQPTLCVVLACGSGYTDDDGNDVALDYEPGAVVLVSELGLKKYSTFPGMNDYNQGTIALTRESEVHMFWPSIAAYETYKKTLNA